MHCIAGLSDVIRGSFGAFEASLGVAGDLFAANRPIRACCTTKAINLDAPREAIRAATGWKHDEQ